jgi:hypothetical protein
MKNKKAAAWRAFVIVLLSIYLPRWHAIRLRRRMERVAASHSD